MWEKWKFFIDTILILIIFIKRILGNMFILFKYLKVIICLFTDCLLTSAVTVLDAMWWWTKQLSCLFSCTALQPVYHWSDPCCIIWKLTRFLLSFNELGLCNINIDLYIFKKFLFVYEFFLDSSVHHRQPIVIVGRNVNVKL